MRRGLFGSNVCRFVILVGMGIWPAVSGSGAFAATPAWGATAATASVAGQEVDLNGTPMTAGAALFPGDVIRLGEGSTVALHFGDRLVLAAPRTEFVVEPEGVHLRRGRLQARGDQGQGFVVTGPYFHVNLVPSGATPGAAEIRLEGVHALVSAVAGFADLTAAGNTATHRLHAGESASLDAAAADASGQNAAGPSAGKVARLIPQVQIDRASQALPAAVADPVFWNDDLRSGPIGRAHIALNDGSQLNLGSNTSLVVLQHDAQAQQTSLDLAVGRMRGMVMKLTNPGSKFEIRTPVGVAGLVGTDFSLEVTNDYVELIVFDGAVRFTLLNGQTILVTSGMKVRIQRSGLGVIGPLNASPSDIQIAQSLTDIPAGQSQVAGAAARPLAPVIVAVSAAAVTVGIGVYLATRERPPVSHASPIAAPRGTAAVSP